MQTNNKISSRGPEGGPTRVAVIGAGIAGIHTAFVLKKMGYEVTVFEKDKRIGGKCYSPNHLDGILEMGAGAISPAYPTIIQLCREFGLRFVKRKT